MHRRLPQTAEDLDGGRGPRGWQPVDQQRGDGLYARSDARPRVTGWVGRGELLHCPRREQCARRAEHLPVAGAAHERGGGVGSEPLSCLAASDLEQLGPWL